MKYESTSEIICQSTDRSKKIDRSLYKWPAVVYCWLGFLGADERRPLSTVTSLRADNGRRRNPALTSGRHQWRETVTAEKTTAKSERTPEENGVVDAVTHLVETLAKNAEDLSGPTHKVSV